MSFIRRSSLLVLPLLALTACGEQEAEEETARPGVLVVGSSTVYPFSNAVAQALVDGNPKLSPVVVESTGTVDGIARFCSGTGLGTPDVVDASRRMTKAEFDSCKAKGVTEIVELQVGLDGIVFASAAERGIELNLTPRLIYEALAATPYGNDQATKNWSDVAPSFPDEPISVFGPPPTSGTREAFVELLMHKGCETNGRVASFKRNDPAAYEKICDTLRPDSAYLDQGEDDDQIVGMVSKNRFGVGVFGYSYLEENSDRLKGLPINGIAPTYENIASLRYPASRPLYIYIKKANLEAMPSLKLYVEQWAKSWSKDGPLAQIGLVPSPDNVIAANAEAAANMTPMTGEDLE